MERPRAFSANDLIDVPGKIFVWAAFFILLIFDVFPCYAAFLIGTKNLDYSFLLRQNMRGETYMLADITGKPLEEGFRLVQNRDTSSSFSFKISQLQKDNLLEGSVLAKLYWTAIRPLKIGQLDSSLALGRLYFPSMYSSWTNDAPAPTTAFSFFTSQILSAKFKEINWRLGIRMNLSSDIFSGNPSYDMLSLSHLDGVWGAEYKKELSLGLSGALSYSGLVRTSSYFPIDFFQNQELGLGMGNQCFLLKYFYPLKYEYKRQNYPFQGKRAEAEIHIPVAFGVRFDMSCVLSSENPTIYRALFSKNIKTVNAGIFASENYQNKQVGFQVSFDEDSFKALENYYISKGHVPTTSQTAIDYPLSKITPEDVEVANLDQLISVIKTPADACWYASRYLNYTDEHNSFPSGMFNFYTPNEVFEFKKGNCTEQASFQKYLLGKNGYETAILGMLGRAFFHSILACKDPITGKWNAIDNSGAYKVYNSQADTYEDLATKIFPGWLSVVVKGDNAKGTYQVDSSTKWYVEDWFEKE